MKVHLWVACALVAASIVTAGCGGGRGALPNYPPVAADDTAYTNMNMAVNIDVLANDADPRGDELSVGSFDPPTVGSVVVESDGTLTYTPQTNFTGFTSFTYTITDPSGKTDTASVAIVVGITVQLQITEIKGLFKPDGFGVGQYQAAYVSGDDLGRVYSNRVFDPVDPTKTIWTKNRQYVELTVDVQPAGASWPPDARIVWRFTDPDDPSNEDLLTHPTAGRTLDPNDYDGVDDDGDGTKDNSDGNDNSGDRDGYEPWEEVHTDYALSNGNETLLTGDVSKVGFNVTDGGGDNFIVTAGVKLTAEGETIAPQSTGVMTVWKRVDMEYVKMTSAPPLDGLVNGNANDALAKAFVELVPQAGAPRLVTDLAEMGPNEYTAGVASDDYVTAAGQFQNEGNDGWFFAAAANYFVDTSGAGGPALLYEGLPLVWSDGVTLGLDPAESLSDNDKYQYGSKVGDLAPTVEGYRVMKTDMVSAQADLYQDGMVLYDYDPFSGSYNGSAPIISHTQGASAADGAEITYGATVDAPGGPILVYKLFVSAVVMREPVGLTDYIIFSYQNFSWVDYGVVGVRPKGYSTPTQYNSMMFNLIDHGYPDPIFTPYAPVSVYGTGALVVTGISPGPGGGLEGRTIVFTTQGGDLGTLIHEFGHAFGFHHNCGNWDYRSNDATGKSCAMHYDFYWMLTRSQPRQLDPWLWGTGGSYYCEEHIAAIRQQNLENLSILGWGN